MSIRIVGGASFPGEFGTSTVSWPLAILTSDDDGVAVDVRLRLLKTIIARFAAGRKADSVLWSVAWGQLQSIDLGQRSVILQSSGQRGCRFVTLTRRRILPLIEELERHNINVIHKKTTIGWFLKSS